MRVQIKPAHAIAMLTFLTGAALAAELTFPIAGTGVTDFYSDNAVITEPVEGEAFYGQNAHYQGNLPSYTDNGDGTVTDNVTGLMWQQDMGEKITWYAAFTKADTLSLGGYDDWRFPTIKEIYSLIQYTGESGGEVAKVKYIDTTVFVQPIGDTTLGEREIDAQTWSATKYVGLTMNKDSTIFGVNFIDGRIKGYPQYNPMSQAENTMYARMVRGNSDYGKNSFVDNGDGTISDLATGLMWLQADDGTTRDWETALSYCENLSYAGHDDWRLPSVKELQSIVDYSRAPQITQSPAIDPLFTCTEINDPDGNAGHYGFYWSSTTHLDGNVPEASACYVAFGEGQGKMTTPQGTNLMDVHGAGCQRSDPKSGNAEDYPEYFGPQGDVRYVYNFVRPVRTISEGATEIAQAGAVNSEMTTSLVNSINGLTLNITVPQAQSVAVTLFSMNGRRIGELTTGVLTEGTNAVTMNNLTLSSGVYVMQIEGKAFSQTKSVVIQ